MMFVVVPGLLSQSTAQLITISTPLRPFLTASIGILIISCVSPFELNMIGSCDRNRDQELAGAWRMALNWQRLTNST